jgi:lysozyme
MFDPRLVADIDSGENCELLAYKDTEHLWTIGWGHLLDQSIDWTGHTITQAQADQWRDVDMQKATAAALRLPEYASLDTDCRRNALIELVFNMGPSRWIEFVDTRAALVRRDWPRAHDELLDSKWAGQVKARRANRLANYFLTGIYPTV